MREVDRGVHDGPVDMSIETAEVLVDQGIYEVQSVMSASRYFVDTIGVPRFVRVAGADSRDLRLDAIWHALVKLDAHPMEWANGRFLTHDKIEPGPATPWMLRTGSAHTYWTPDRTKGRPPIYFVTSSACRRLIRHNSLPDFLADIPLDAILQEHEAHS